jgi:hypothetical protein
MYCTNICPKCDTIFIPYSGIKKKCKRCIASFPATNRYFYVQNKEKGYLYSNCKKCTLEIKKQKPNNFNYKKYYEKNKNKIRIQQKKYKQKKEKENINLLCHSHK